ncbi:polymeric immunoglobulin receptor-like [Micropterus salmoides]|uniref:polymeric immunoglobulin receptor-like n=1 Tax=Micropterus salmoides TaxID=27706 RepID=UPI0018EE34C2|nr:polymeric immunoglobulin receptor-like [Micropterus salmoides]
MMKGFLLLILLLMAGCEDSSEQSGEDSEVIRCREGWVEFTCKYPKQHESISVVTPKNTTIQTTKKDVWENKGRVSLYHDTNNKNLRVVIKQLEPEDFGNYTCKFTRRDSSSDHKVKLEVEKKMCQRQFNQTAYRTAKTTITCNYTGNKYKFFSKENGSICEDILSTKSSLKSNGTFTLTETNSSFSLSISNVSSHDAGVYRCGVETHEGSYRAALRKIQLKVEDITNLTKSLTVGQDLTYWCEYPNGALINKFICKGEDPSICQPLVSTQQNKKTGRFSIKEDNKKRNVTITVRGVTTDDTGTYWCGAKSTDKTRSNPFFHKLVMTVGLGQNGDGFWYNNSTTITIAAVICVAVLVLGLIFVLICKRFKRSKNTINEEAQYNNEDRAYEEIQELPQMPGSGRELKSVYATANFPTNPSSASQHYYNINIHS